MKKIIAGLIVLAVVQLHAQVRNPRYDTAGIYPAGNIHAADPRGDSLAAFYSHKAAALMDRDTALGDFYRIDNTGVYMFAGAGMKAQNVPEYFIAWNELDIFRNIVSQNSHDDAMCILLAKGDRPFSKDVAYKYGKKKSPPLHFFMQEKPLNGFRFAIDPGHFASDSATAHIEDKYLDFYENVPGADSVRIFFWESMLTWQTAVLLAQKLRDAGAEVMMTRQSYGLTAMGKTFQQWKQDDYPRCLDSLLALDPTNKNLRALKSGKKKDDRSIFRFVFRDVELKKRADLINAFHPDLTVVIHYNVDNENKDWKKPTDKDFCMTFVGGSFERGELDDPGKRFDFLRLLLTDDIPQSISACGIAAKQFSEDLDVPLAKSSDASYLQKDCIYAGEPGVFCRNLALTRMITGPVIYGETLYEDNVKEAFLLNQTPSPAIRNDLEETRVEEVADAYFRAVCNWAKLH
ncbi:MAG TPA: hypothetical protein VFU15_16745 [Bacteroidia bacterium]|nr:hypothetical protein [Bacteroidia bacterium]